MDPNTPLPNTVTIPPTLFSKWQKVPRDQIIQGLSKDDWERLLHCLDHQIAASGALQASLIAYSNGDTLTANDHSWEASRQLIEGQNQMRLFMIGLITAAT